MGAASSFILFLDKGRSVMWTRWFCNTNLDHKVCTMLRLRAHDKQHHVKTSLGCLLLLASHCMMGIT